MARQLTDLNEILGNFVSDGDYLLLRDMSDREDKKIKIEELGNALFLSQHRVGSVYITYSEDDDPNLRGGTWVLASKGKSIVGVDPDDAAYDTPGETGGSKGYSLTNSNLPRYDGRVSVHGEGAATVIQNVTGAGVSAGTNRGSYRTGGGNTSGASSKDSFSLNIGQATPVPVSTVSPYETAFVWRRTA